MSGKGTFLNRNEQKKRGNFEKISFRELLNDFSLLLNKRNGGFSAENSSLLQL